MCRSSCRTAVLPMLLLVVGAALVGRIAAQPVAPAGPGQVALGDLAIVELAARSETNPDACDIDGHIAT